jgi:hypothetical protein
MFLPVTCDKGIHPYNINRWYCVLKNPLKFEVLFSPGGYITSKFFTCICQFIPNSGLRRKNIQRDLLRVEHSACTNTTEEI